MGKPRPALPPLAPVHAIDRLLSGPEYYHASVGRHPRTLLRPRDVVAVLEGTLAENTHIDWQAALDQVSAANPGCRLRLYGKLQGTRWRSDGQSPRVRLLPECAWDGRSSEGDEFIFNPPLCLEDGRVCELIVTGRQRIKLIFRAAHAAMDGMGVNHCLQELMRVLRGEPLLGTNATYTDIQLMRHIESRHQPFHYVKPAPLGGPPRGEERGGQWRRITLPGPQPALLPHIIQIVAEHARRYTEDTAPVRIALPISVKRHAPDLTGTCNFTNMLYLDIAPQADARQIKTQLRELLNRNADAFYSEALELVRYLPFTWLDRLLSVNDRNYTRPHLAETALLTVLGPLKRTPFCGGGFQAETLYGLPQKENAFITAVGFQGKFEVCVAMANVFASEGRLDAFLQELQQKLTPMREHSTIG